jgi:hypothetical protein
MSYNANGKTWVVDQSGSGDYSTITDAVTIATSGDTIDVRAGTYVEGVSVNGKTLVITGFGSSSTTIYNSSFAVSVGESSVGALTISGFKIMSTSNNALYVYRSGSQLVAKQCVLESSSSSSGSSAAVEVLYGSEAQFYNCVFQNSDYGVWASSEGTVVDVINCIIYNNDVGVQVGYGGNYDGTINIQNSIFHSNDIAAKKYSANSGYLLSIYNCYYNNPTVVYNTSKGLGDITSDPLFTNISEAYYSLQSTSPSKDAGNPSPAYTDTDGSRNDLGVYGGPNTWSQGPVITNLSVSPLTVDLGGTITISATAKTK